MKGSLFQGREQFHDQEKAAMIKLRRYIDQNEFSKPSEKRAATAINSTYYRNYDFN